MLIRLDGYLEALKIRIHNNMVKVVTGIRRCEKKISRLSFHYLLHLVL